ncbi:OsmC family peroxiredoxin [Verrucomicrobia bacterium S94]|nr:OsmC family peroxiredoxin [Verrucomicrobia bacterium S94]
MMPKKTVTIESKLNDKFVIESEVRGHKLVIDQPANAGGTDTGVTPLEMVFVSLAGCLGTIGRIVAMQKRIELRGMSIKVEGDLDTDGLLGKPVDGRIGFEGITVTVDVDADLTDDEKLDFLREVDHRCPVSENLLHETPVTIRPA